MKIKTSAPISLDKTQTSTLHVISQCTVGSKEHVGTIFYISIVFHHLKRLRAQWTRTKRPFRRQRCVTWWWREGTEWLTEAAQWGHGPAQSLAQALCFRHELSFPGWRSMWELWQSLLTPPSRRTTEIRWREKHVRRYQVWLPISNLTSRLGIQEWVLTAPHRKQEHRFLTSTKNGFYAILSRHRNYLKASAIFQLTYNWEHMTAEIAWLALPYLWTLEESMFLQLESIKRQKGKQGS